MQHFHDSVKMLHTCPQTPKTSADFHLYPTKLPCHQFWPTANPQQFPHHSTVCHYRIQDKNFPNTYRPSTTAARLKNHAHSHKEWTIPCNYRQLIQRKAIVWRSGCSCACPPPHPKPALIYSAPASPEFFHAESAAHAKLLHGNSYRKLLEFCIQPCVLKTFFWIIFYKLPLSELQPWVETSANASRSIMLPAQTKRLQPILAAARMVSTVHCTLFICKIVSHTCHFLQSLATQNERTHHTHHSQSSANFLLPWTNQTGN